MYLFWKAYKERLGNNTDSFAPSSLLLMVLVAFLALLLGDWLAGEVKRLVMKARPFTVFEEARLLVGRGRSYSLPSSHATNSFAVAVSFFYFTWRRIPPAWALYPFLVACLVAFSRVYVGVHYPSDVLAGALLGTAIALALIALFSHCRTRYRTKPYTTVLFAGLLALSVFRIYYILHGPLDLGPDEAHYWEWSRRLDLSYYSKGPMIAYLIKAGAALFGDTVFGIRSMAIVFSALSSIYLYKLTSLMYGEGNSADEHLQEGKYRGVAAALLFQAIPLFSTFGVVFTIDGPFLFFWILALYFFYRAVADERRSARWTDWLLVGAAVGLGLLTKYTMAFFMLSAFLLLLLSDRRALLKSAKPYGALLLSLVIFSPVIIWNFEYEWVTFRHTAGQAHVAEGLTLSLRSFVEFLGSQVGVITPVLFGMMLYALIRLKVSVNDFRSKTLFYFSLPVIAFFLLKSLQAKVQANWAMTGYVTGVIAISVYYFGAGRRVRERLTAGKKALLIGGVGLALLVTCFSHYPAVLKLTPKSDPSARLRGWAELGKEVSSLKAPLEREGTVFIFSDRYQVASLLAFYVEGQPRTYAVSLGRRMNQYDLWPDMNSAAAELRRGREVTPPVINGIFVQTGNTTPPREVAAAFSRIEKKTFKVYEGERLLREYSLFICYNFGALRAPAPQTF